MSHNTTNEMWSPTADTAEADILLLGDPGVVEPLRTRLGRRKTVAVGDPYDAILALHEKPHRCVVVSAPQPEFPGLCRALRRVHAHGPLMAVGTTATEPAMRSLTPSVLDDYFISPPTPADVERIRAADRSTGVSPAKRGTGVSPVSRMGVPPMQTVPSGETFPFRPDQHGLEARATHGRDAHATVAGGTPASHAAVPVTGPVALAPSQWAELLAVTSLPNLQEAVTGLLAACGFSAAWRRAENIPVTQSPLLVLTDDVGQMFLVPAAGHAPPGPAARALLTAIGPLMGALAKNAVRIESLHKLAITDHLTGAYNRRYFYHLTEQILARAAQANFRVTLLLYDIDDFKHYNETHGHAAGDEILRQVAVLMKKTSRTHDIVARIGGDEFAVLFWDADPPRSPNSKPLETFAELAERFRQAVRGHAFSFLGPEAKGTLTISGGLSHFPTEGNTCVDLLRVADAGLRLAKKQGKDRIYLAGKG